MIKMKLCPFCGETDNDRLHIITNKKTKYVHCGTCGADGPPVISNSKRDAIINWNDRISLTNETPTQGI